MAITYLSGQRIQGIEGVGMGSTANGTITGATHSETDPPVGAGWLDFNGTSSDDFTADGAADACTTKGTVSVWFRTNGYATGDGDRLFEFGDGSGEFLASIASTQKIDVIMQHGASMQWKGSTDVGSITDDTWYHLVITQNGTSPKFWIGKISETIEEQTTLVTEADVTKWFESSWDAFKIGENQAGTGGYLAGGICDFAVWDRALSDGEIANLHNSSGSQGVSASTIPAGLRVHYLFAVDGVATNASTLIDDKASVTDVPVGSEFEETDTYKFYQMSDTWVTTSGSLSAGVYHPSGKGDATDGWNTTGIGVVGGGNRPELDWWNGTTWADKGVDMTKAMEGACGVGTSSSITVAGGDYQSDDSGAGNACQHWNNTSWTTKANMDQGKSTASSMGTSSSWLSCGGEITGGGGGRTAEVQEYDLDDDSWSAGDGTSISNGMCVGGRSTDYTITVSANAFNGTNWTSVSVPDISWSMYAGIGGGNYDGFWVMGGNLSGGYGTGIGAVTYYNGTSWTTKANCALTEGGAGGANNGGTNPQIGGGNEVGESGNGNWTSGQYWGGAWLERGTT